MGWLVVSALVFTVLGFQFVMHDSIPSVIVLYVYMHAPLVYMTFMSNQSDELQLGLQWSWIGSICGILGFTIKQTAIPERWCPQYFQMWLMSHQLWHILTMAGPLCCLLAGTRFLMHVGKIQEC